MSTNHNEENTGIEEILLALENDENLPERENYRLAVRNHQNYFIPYLSDQDNSQQVFTMPTQNNAPSIPIFLSEEVFSLFEDNYLKEYGYLDKIRNDRQSLGLRRLSGDELFTLLPKSSLSAFLVLFSESDGFLINFKLIKTFIECFQEFQVEKDWETLLEPEIDPAHETNEAQRKINLGQTFRKLFTNSEWVVLISQATSNKLLKGEVSRENFDLDRSGDQRIVIFSDPRAFEDFKNLTGQTGVRFHTIKVESKRIFGSDLSKYGVIIVNPGPPRSIRITRRDFALVNELFAAVEVEKRLSQISKFRLGHGRDYIEVKEFQKYILPIDKRLTEPNLPKFEVPVWLVEISPGELRLPVFTAEDNFEAFRLQCLEKFKLPGTNLVEPHPVDGQRLFEILSSRNAPLIIFNLGSQIDSIACEANFALKVYCA